MKRCSYSFRKNYQLINQYHSLLIDQQRLKYFLTTIFDKGMDSWWEFKLGF